ncbi:MAG: hypothetical protein R2800_05875 [Flavipsychrobacter sp.]
MLGDKRFWITWILIVIVCWVDYNYLNETEFHKTLDERLRQSLHILIYAVVVAIGYYYYRAYDTTWPKYLWLISYVAGLLIYFIGGFVDIFFLDLTLQQKNHFGAVRLFFSSPIPLTVIYMMHRLSMVNND